MDIKKLKLAIEQAQKVCDEMNKCANKFILQDSINEVNEAINYSCCSTKLKDIGPISFDDWLKDNCEKLHGALYRYKDNVLDRYDMRYVYMREVKQCF